jgi:DNA-binding beta-propeller fold protein YncE
VIATIVNWHDSAAVAASPDGSKVYVAAEGAVSIMNATTNSFIGQTTIGAFDTGGLVISPDGNKFFFCRRD